MIREWETERMFLRKFGHNISQAELNSDNITNNKRFTSAIEFLEVVNNNTEKELMSKGANNYPFENYLQGFIKK